MQFSDRLPPSVSLVNGYMTDNSTSVMKTLAVGVREGRIQDLMNFKKRRLVTERTTNVDLNFG